MTEATVTLQSAVTGPAAVARLSGRIDHTSAEQVRELLTQALAAVVAPQTALIICLSAVPYISSAGLRVLMVLSREAKARGVQLLLTDLQPVVSEVFKISHFDLVIPVHTDLEGALASLN